MPKSKRYLNGKNAALQAGDEAEGEWPCERLVASVRPQPQRMMRIQRGAR
jgi:hypothetical protein